MVLMITLNAGMNRHESVTNNAIPLDQAEAAWDRLDNRHLYAEVVAADCEDFLNAAENMQFMHVKTVVLTQQQLQGLIKSCKKYAENLGWELDDVQAS